MGYSKLHSAILTSSVWCEPYFVRVVWVGLLAIKDQDGIIAGTTRGLARTIGVTADEMEQALEVLSSPDTESQSPAEDGRRIVRENIGGRDVWRVVNHEFYKKLESIEERRAKDAERKRRSREVADSHRRRGRAVTKPDMSRDVTDVTNVTPSDQIRSDHNRSDQSPQPPEGESASSPEPARKPKRATAKVRQVFEAWKADTGHDRSVLDLKRRSRIEARLREGFTPEELIAAIKNRRNDPWLMGTAEGSSRVYDGLETLLRDAAQVERLRDLTKPARQRPRGAAPVQRDDSSPYFNPYEL